MNRMRSRACHIALREGQRARKVTGAAGDGPGSHQPMMEAQEVHSLAPYGQLSGSTRGSHPRAVRSPKHELRDWYSRSRSSNRGTPAGGGSTVILIYLYLRPRTAKAIRRQHRSARADSHSPRAGAPAPMSFLSVLRTPIKVGIRWLSALCGLVPAPVPGGGGSQSGSRMIRRSALVSRDRERHDGAHPDPAQMHRSRRQRIGDRRKAEHHATSR